MDPVEPNHLAPDEGRTSSRPTPAWRSHTEGETILGASLIVLVAATLQWFLPERLSPGPRWLVPALAVILLAVVASLHPHRMNRRTRWGRSVGVALLVVLGLSNLTSGVFLVLEMVGERNGTDDPVQLLLSGASIWLTNVIVFGLFYWETDRGGPVERARGTHRYTDFLFPQMDDPDRAPPDWEPMLVDYLYLAFTNATAFSPTDVLPLTRWAKVAMLVQSALSLALIGLVIARAVNLLAS
jgi:uncharacterized membrane protein